MNSKGASTSGSTAAVSVLGKRKYEASTSGSASVYDVFLSFCGGDTRTGFTDFLYTYLVGASIKTFRDNEELWVGEEIGSELLKAIKESKISIPIFSQNYANSKWCLRELEQMVECHKNEGQKIFPIFFDVDPSHVKNQEGSYKEAFRLHEEKFVDKDIVHRWKDALKAVGELKGLELKKATNWHQGELVKLVVDKVLMELQTNYTHVHENLVGMDNHIQELMGLLEVDSDDVRIIGIHGMGGLGKTTITEVIYNKIYKNFNGQCFLHNVREKSKYNDGIVELQKQFISSVQKRGPPNVYNVDHGRNLIKDVVCKKKLLLVLDDVDDYSQVDRVMGEPSWYGAQSRVILTTRDKHVLDLIKDSCVVYRSYNPNFMNDTCSLQLFSKHAFKKDCPEEYNSLSKEVVSIAAGLPLSLVVLGSAFFGMKDKRLWEENLKKLQRIPHKDVLTPLMYSFEALDKTEREIFLDIACLFIDHDKTRPTYMWESCKLYPYLGINVLVSRSLITIDDEDKFQMHDQLRDLGRHIDREEGLQGKQSRLWRPDEALEVLQLNQGTSRIKALRLREYDRLKDYDRFDAVAAAPHLRNLRYLSMCEVKNVDGDFKDLLPNLRWLHCNWMLNKSSLRNLNMKNLVVLDISCNPVLRDDWDGWRQLKMANNLKVLDLSGCEDIQTLPNLSNSAKLVELNLESCSGLTEIQGLEKLEFLQVLNINGCYSLRRLPNISSLKDLKVFNAEHCSGLSQIEGLCGLISLEYLQLGGCRYIKEGLGDLSKLNKLKVLTGAPGLDFTDFSNFKHLKKLEICGNNRMEIQKLDGLEALEDLEITYCSSIVRLPNLSYLNRLKTLTIWSCEQLIEIQDLRELKSLEGLRISYCRLVNELPNLSPLHKLKDLAVTDCEKISEICGIEELKSLERLLINTCSSVKTLPDLSGLEKLKHLNVTYCKKICDIPGIEELKSLSYLDIGGSMGLRHLYDLDLPNVKIEPDKDDFEETYTRLARERRLVNDENSESEEYPTNENSDTEEDPTDENTED